MPWFYSTPLHVVAVVACVFSAVVLSWKGQFSGYWYCCVGRDGFMVLIIFGWFWAYWRLWPITTEGVGRRYEKDGMNERRGLENPTCGLRTEKTSSGALVVPKTFICTKSPFPVLNHVSWFTAVCERIEISILLFFFLGKLRAKKSVSAWDIEHSTIEIVWA